MDKELMTMEAACEYLGITTGQMYQLTHKKLIPYSRPTGRKLYFLKSDLFNFATSNRVASNEEIQEQARKITRIPATI